MVESELVLGGLEAVLDRPAMAFNGNERLDVGPGRAPCGEECEITVADIAPDQKATGPKPRFRLVIFVGIEIGEFAVGPVMKPRASTGERPVVIAADAESVRTRISHCCLEC